MSTVTPLPAHRARTLAEVDAEGARLRRERTERFVERLAGAIEAAGEIAADPNEHPGVRDRARRFVKLIEDESLGLQVLNGRR